MFYFGKKFYILMDSNLLNFSFVIIVLRKFYLYLIQKDILQGFLFVCVFI